MRTVHATMTLLAGTFVLAVVAGQSTAAAQAPAQAPAAPAASPQVEAGRKAIGQVCSQCHSPQHWVIQRKAAAGWRQTVYHMIGRGAPVEAEEIEPIVTFLTANYGPNSPLPGSAASQGPLPAEAGREILMSSCTNCHAVEMVRMTTKTEAAWLETIDRMIGNGAKITPGEKTTLARFAAANFGAR